MEETKSEIEEEFHEDDLGGSKSSYVTGKTQREKFWRKKRVPITLRPIRLIQLILDIMLFSVAISLMTRIENPMNTPASIILIILFASFAIVMCIDAVGQIGGYLTPDLPMFLIAFLGWILFTSAAQAVYLLFYQTAKNVSILVLISLCLVAALLFLLDAMIIIMYWRYTCTRNDNCLGLPCHSGKSLTLLYQRHHARDETSEMLEAKNCKSNPIARDISTSFSQEKLQRSSNSGFFGYRMSNNRVGVGPRRQYVDRPTNTDSNISLKFVQTQTQAIEPVESMDHEISAIAVAEEKDAQTLSQCPACSASLDYSPGGICPTFLALIQSFGMFSCAENSQFKLHPPILVDRGTLPGSNSSFGVTESTIMVTKRPPRVYETHACPTHGAGLIAQKAGLPNPVTRMSLTHSIRKNKRTQTPASKPIVITNKHQNTEIDVVEETTNTEGSSLALENEESEKGEITEKSLPTEESSLPRIPSSSSERIRNYVDQKENPSQNDVLVAEVQNDRTDPSSGNFQAPTQESSLLQEIEGGIPMLEDSFSPQKSPERVDAVENRNSKTIFENAIGSKTGSLLLNEESSSTSPKILSSLGKRDTVSSVSNETSNSRRSIFQRNSTIGSIMSAPSPIRQVSSIFAEIISPLESGAIGSAEIVENSIDLRELASPSRQLPCKCSQLQYYYYRDVFGRYICGLCAHKYLIKIPQRYTAIKPIGDLRCCSCSQAIFYQTANPAQTKCRKCCRCKYQMYVGSRK